MNKHERRNFIKLHPRKSAEELGRMLGVSSKTVRRDRAELAEPDIPAPASSDSPLENLKTTRDELRRSLQLLDPTGEPYRKRLATLGDLELKISKLTPAVSDDTSWEFIAILDSKTGLATTIKLKNAPAEVRGGLERGQDDDVDERRVRMKLANEAFARYDAAVQSKEGSAYEQKLRHAEWISALSAE